MGRSMYRPELHPPNSQCDAKCSTRPTCHPLLTAPVVYKVQCCPLQAQRQPSPAAAAFTKTPPDAAGAGAPPRRQPLRAHPLPVLGGGRPGPEPVHRGHHLRRPHGALHRVRGLRAPARGLCPHAARARAAPAPVTRCARARRPLPASGSRCYRSSGASLRLCAEHARRRVAPVPRRRRLRHAYVYDGVFPSFSAGWPWLGQKVCGVTRAAHAMSARAV